MSARNPASFWRAASPATQDSSGPWEQDLVVLKSEQDNKPANSDAPTNKEFDVFRIQTTRNITTLQSQVQNLNQRLNAPAAATPLGQ